LIAFNLNAVGNRRFFPLAATGHPRNEPVTEIIVSHLWGAVQCTQWTYLAFKGITGKLNALPP